MERITSSGRRKAAVARVHVNKGKGKVTINKKDVLEYFPVNYLANKVLEPLKVTESEGQFDFYVNVHGGGIKGQAEAVRLGLAKALVAMEAEKKPALKAERMMTRDARVVERKKPGYRKARKKEQYSKR